MKHVKNVISKRIVSPAVAITEDGKLEAGDYADIFGTLDNVKGGVTDLKGFSNKGQA